MHSIPGIYFSKKKSVLYKGQQYYPLKLSITYKKGRMVFFKSEKELEEAYQAFEQISGHYDIKDYYEFKNLISEGTYGKVYKAVNIATNEVVAIKKIGKLKLTDEQLDLQRKEIEVLKVSQHPNVVNLIDIFESMKYFFVILEYLEGGDLYDYLDKRDFKIDEEHAREFFGQIVAGVGYLHQLGIVHRDLKLENIMMTSNERNAVPKIVDFGLVKILGPG